MIAGTRSFYNRIVNKFDPSTRHRRAVVVLDTQASQLGVVEQAD
jgi:hypothetical protein